MILPVVVVGLLNLSVFVISALQRIEMLVNPLFWMD